MASKEPCVSVSVRLTFKNPPQGYLGITSEDWSIGKDKPAKLRSLAYYVALHLAEFYLDTVGAVQNMSDADLQAEMAAVAGALSTLRITAEPEPEKA